MKYSQASPGRVFVIRLEHGDTLPRCIEEFAARQGVSHALVLLIGGIGKGRVVAGPRDSGQRPPDPMLLPVDGAHETVGAGLIAPDENGKPVLHIHASLGRSGHTLTGCLRPGVETWIVGEVVLYEIVGASAVRRFDPETGFSLLQPE